MNEITHNPEQEYEENTTKQPGDEALDASEKQLRRIILISSVIVVVLIVAILGIGLWKDLVQTPRLAIATVDGEEITVEMYQTRMRYFRLQLLQETVRLEKIIEGDSADEQSLASYESSLAQIEMLLDSPSLLGSSTMNSLVEDLILERKAQELGIVISDEEIDAAYFDSFKEDAGNPETYNDQQFREDYAAFLEKKASANLTEADVREMRRNILLRDAILQAITASVTTDETAQQAVFKEWLETERLALAENMAVDQTLMEKFTPEEPSLSDPKVFKALYGMTVKDHLATQNAEIQD
ncbi:MAG: SurA N-terminal domain-containing protein [Anaerolineae bacterium]|nr:SurA N-terminal domain-containing protein [Anaerolineae bacterium]